MTDAQKEKQKKNLVKLNLMDESGTLLDCVQAGRYEKLLGFLGSWSQGWLYLTDTAAVYPAGLGSEHVVIPYRSITRIEPCRQYLFPLGIAITYTNADGTQAEQRFSVMGRDKWIAFLEERRKA